MTAASAKNPLQKVWEALRLDASMEIPCSFAFSKTKPIPGSWKCFTSDLAIPFWHIHAPGAKQSEIRKVSSGISAENFMLLADLGEASLLVMKTFGKGKGEKPLFKPLRKPEDYEEAANALQKFDLKSDDLLAHASLQAAKELLEMTAELNALVARHYGLSHEELAVILESFSSFEEDPELENMEEIKWSDTLMRKFNGEVRRRVMRYFDSFGNISETEAA